MRVRLAFGGLLSSLLLLALLGTGAHLPARAPVTPAAAPAAEAPALPVGLAPMLATALAADAGDAYAPHSADAGADAPLAADNPAQHLAATFLPDGVHLCPTDSCAGGAGEWGMRLIGVGADPLSAPLTPTAPVRDGARVAYPRDTLTEWYVNSPWASSRASRCPSRRCGRRGAMAWCCALDSMACRHG